MAESNAERVLGEIVNEREHQDRRWGEQNHDDLTWLAILMEEVGEVAKAILETPKSTATHICHEIIQVAAVAAAWRESRLRQVDRVVRKVLEEIDEKEGEKESAAVAKAKADAKFREVGLDPEAIDAAREAADKEDDGRLQELARKKPGTVGTMTDAEIDEIENRRGTVIHYLRITGRGTLAKIEVVQNDIKIASVTPQVAGPWRLATRTRHHEFDKDMHSLVGLRRAYSELGDSETANHFVARRCKIIAQKWNLAYVID